MREFFKDILKNGRQAFLVSVVLMVICGLAYPLMLTGVSAILFPYQADGSLIVVDGKTVGSEIVGQEFTEECYMWSRPSAYNYNVYVEDENGNKTYSDGSEFSGLSSGSNNYAPSNSRLIDRVKSDMERFLEAHPYLSNDEIPTDMLTASGSGLDPHISPESAQIQIQRISQASGISENEIEKIVENNTKGKLFGVFGEETVNVLKVNIDIKAAMEKI